MIREPRTGPADPRPRRRRHRHHHALHAAPPHCPAVSPRCDARLRAGGHPVGSAFPARRRGPAWRWGPRGRRRLVSAPPPCPTTGERGRGRRTCPGQATAIRTTSAMSPARLPGTGITAGQIGPAPFDSAIPVFGTWNGKSWMGGLVQPFSSPLRAGCLRIAVRRIVTENDVAACGSVTLAGRPEQARVPARSQRGEFGLCRCAGMSRSCWCELFSVSAWHRPVERGGRDGNGRRRQRSGQTRRSIPRGAELRRISCAPDAEYPDLAYARAACPSWQTSRFDR